LKETSNGWRKTYANDNLREHVEPFIATLKEEETQVDHVKCGHEAEAGPEVRSSEEKDEEES
jgi:hypothetical protein